AGEGAAAFRHPGRGVVRAAGAEVWRSLKRHHVVVVAMLLGVDPGKALRDAIRSTEADETPADDAGDLQRAQLAVRGQDPLTALVVLADDPRAPIRRPVVELVLELRFDDAAFFLHDEDLLETFRETPHPLGFELPWHRHLV